MRREPLSASCVQFSMARCTSGYEVSLTGLSQTPSLQFPLQTLLVLLCYSGGNSACVPVGLLDSACINSHCSTSLGKHFALCLGRGTSGALGLMGRAHLSPSFGGGQLLDVLIL